MNQYGVDMNNPEIPQMSGLRHPWVTRGGWLGLLLLGSAMICQAADPAAAPLAEQMSLGAIVRTGGWIMYLLGFISVAGLALIIYFFITLRQEVIIPSAFTRELGRSLAAGEADRAREACRGDSSPVSAVALAALDYTERAREADPTMIKEIIEGEGSRQAAQIQNQTSYLLDIGVIAPMIGLLGTVLGMLTAFNAVALDIARAKPIVLAAGVSQALVTTAAGLLVGIPAMIFYAYFRGRTGKLIAQLESVSATMLTQLIGTKEP